MRMIYGRGWDSDKKHVPWVRPQVVLTALTRSRPKYQTTVLIPMQNDDRPSCESTHNVTSYQTNQDVPMKPVRGYSPWIFAIAARLYRIESESKTANNPKHYINTCSKSIPDIKQVKLETRGRIRVLVRDSQGSLGESEASSCWVPWNSGGKSPTC